VEVIEEKGGKNRLGRVGNNFWRKEGSCAAKSMKLAMEGRSADSRGQVDGGGSPQKGPRASEREHTAKRRSPAGGNGERSVKGVSLGRFGFKSEESMGERQCTRVRRRGVEWGREGGETRFR